MATHFNSPNDPDLARKRELRKKYRMIFRIHAAFQGSSRSPTLPNHWTKADVDYVLARSIHFMNEDEPYIEKPIGAAIIRFVVATGYKDAPLPPADDLRLTTALHELAKDPLLCFPMKCFNQVLRDLFDIYDANYLDEESGLTHFHVACHFGYASGVATFLRRGVDPNLRVSKTGDTPLHLALAGGHMGVAQLLMAEKATNPWLPNAKGATPLHVLCRRSTPSAEDDAARVMLFFAMGRQFKGWIMVNHRDEQGNAPLHLALFRCRGNRRLVELLLFNGADPNLPNGRAGWTPLHLAVATREPDLVEALVLNGAELPHSASIFIDRDIECEIGQWTADFAKQANRKLKRALGALGCLEQLRERAGYRLRAYDLQTFSSMFYRLDIRGFKARYFTVPWSDVVEDEEVARLAAESRIARGVSLLDAIHMEPKELVKRITFTDFYKYHESFERCKPIGRRYESYWTIANLRLFDAMARELLSQWTGSDILSTMYYEWINAAGPLSS